MSDDQSVTVLPKPGRWPSTWTPTTLMPGWAALKPSRLVGVRLFCSKLPFFTKFGPAWAAPAKATIAPAVSKILRIVAPLEI